MKNKKSFISSFIFIILGIIIGFLVLISSYYQNLLKTRIFEDANVLNEINILNANIQRYVKLKISQNHKYTEIENTIDYTFNAVKNTLKKNENIIPAQKSDYFFENFSKLQKQWEMIKKTNNNTLLINLSENSWEEFNSLNTYFLNIHTLKFDSVMNQMNILLYLSIFILSFLIIIIYLKIKKGLEIQTIKDKLTGLYNRLYFNEMFEYYVNKYNRTKKPFSMMIIDIDNFKKINDTYGHATGDSVLKKLGQTINKSIRNLDIAFRYGGEEFVIIFPNTDLYHAFNAAERIRENVSKNIIIDLKSITISGGIGEYKGEKPIEFFKKIDKALYEAKNSGKNKIVISD